MQWRDPRFRSLCGQQASVLGALSFGGLQRITVSLVDLAMFWDGATGRKLARSSVMRRICNSFHVVASMTTGHSTRGDTTRTSLVADAAPPPSSPTSYGQVGTTNPSGQARFPTPRKVSEERPSLERHILMPGASS